MQKKLLGLLFFISFSSLALSHYPAALKNHSLKEELSEESDRVITKSIDWFSAAVDGHTYLRTLESDDFYHGIGYWLQARSEFRPSKYFTLNTRSIFYSGSISYGYTAPTENYHLFSFSGVWPTSFLGGKLEARVMDLGRQTIGSGLLVEQKEMAGLLLKLSYNTNSLTVRVDGTGTFMLVDDMMSPELRLFDGLFTVGAILWNPQANRNGYGSKENSYYYFSSSAKLIGKFMYQFESGVMNEQYAGLLSLGIDHKSDRFAIKTKVQGRFYGPGFGDKFIGNIENIYVSYDQYDKQYTDASNVFTMDNNVYVYSLIFDLRFFLSDKLEFHTLNEVGRFDFLERDDHEFYYYRVGFTYYPFAGRKGAISFFASNKVLRSSDFRPPHMYASTNEPLFKNKNFIGLEGSFRF